MPEGPRILPPPPVQSLSELTLESLMRGTQLSDLASWQEKKLPSSTLDVRKRGPGTTEKAIDRDAMYFSVRSRTTDGLYYRFITMVGWKGLYAPKELLPPDHLLDEIYRDWGLVCEPHQLSSEYRVREKARQIILEQEGLATESDKDRSRWQEFMLFGPATRAPFRFFSTKEWRGLKAPRRVVPGAERGYSGIRYIDIFSESEIEGRKNVRKAAMELVVNYEALQAAPKKTAGECIKPSIVLYGEDIVTFNTIQAMLAHCDQVAGPSAVGRWMIRQVKDKIPPQEEWDALRKQMLEEERKIKAERRARNSINKNPELAIKKKLGLPKPDTD